MNVFFTKTAWEQYKKWQKKDQKILERINELIKAVQSEPFKGIGKPEPLRQNLKGFWSRRITLEHRLVYRIRKDSEDNYVMEILTCEYHY